jgi:mono/diheme cytochrome c family protein
MTGAVAIRRISKAPTAMGLFFFFWLILSLVLPCRSMAAAAAATTDHEARKADAEQYFRQRVTPFVTTYCVPCHQNRRPTRAGVNFSPALKDPGHAAFTEQWKRGAARVMAHDMPPKGAPQPDEDGRKMFADWLGKLKYLSHKDPGPFVLRRLTKTEYANTLRDLYGVDPSIAAGLPDEVSGEGYLNSLSPLQLEQYLNIADQVLRRIVAPDGAPPTAVQKRLFGEPLARNAADPRAAARNVARSLARKAYRRPPTEAELDVLLTTYDLGRRNNLTHQQSLHLMLKAILVSPQFLFITPAARGVAETTAAATGIVPLDDYQLASRLSYLLWATLPDDELMALADSGRLHEPEVLQAQAKRLLDDRRSRALFDGFGAHWLRVGGLQRQVFDPALFPQMTPAMRQAMYDEVRLFFESIVREDQSVIRFVDADYSYLNETLAGIYGLQKTVKGPAMRRVRLSDGNRGGVLGMPGILAATSFPNRTSPVKRGIWVLEQVLGDHVPAAPPDVPALDKQDQAAVANLTVRQRTELHRTNPVCANCHQILDPIGFGLEKFDAIGRWRDRDSNGQPIDATGELPGGRHFSGPRDLKGILAERTGNVARNLLERLLAYALGRKLEGYDEIVVDQLMDEGAAAAGGGGSYRMRSLIYGVVTSYPFTHRRVEDRGGINEQQTRNQN